MEMKVGVRATISFFLRKVHSLTHLRPAVKLADYEALLGVDLQVEPPHEAVEVQQVVGGLVAGPPHLPPHAEQQREAGVHLRRHCLQGQVRYMESAMKRNWHKMPE